MENAEYDSSRPLAEQVAQKIKDYILEEKLKAGDKLPTETALAKEMGVARSTVREAIKRLESQNILTVRHGAGSFVTDQPGLADDPLGLDFIEDKERRDRLSSASLPWCTLPKSFSSIRKVWDLVLSSKELFATVVKL